MRLALLTLLVLTGTAAAKPAGGRPFPAPPSVEVVSGDPTVAQHVMSRSAVIARCMNGSRATFVRARITLSYGANRKVRSVGIRGGGATFARCVGRALRGLLSEQPVRGGRGRVVIAVRKGAGGPVPVPVPAPTPTPTPTPTTGDIHTCRVDDDCTIHFRLYACIPGNPVAVNKLDPAKVRATYPIEHDPCGMGGPQYDRLRESNEGRYSAACEARRCVVRDAGPRPSMLDTLHP